jgi:hypothetical protein
MKDADGDGETLRDLIKGELEKCTDLSLLDLIHKLLSTN